MRRFPALYRMPVAYLVVAVAITTAVGWGRLWARVSGDEAKVGGTSPGLAVLSAIAPPPPSPRVAPRAAIADATLKTPQGVRRKVLVADRVVFPRPTPDGEPSALAIAPYAIRFVIDETPSQVRVGSATGQSDGWVARSSVVDWNSRLVARPTPRSTRPGADIYVDRSCLASAVSGRPCPRHAEHCPGDVEDAEGGAGGPGSLWAILNVAETPGGAGEPRTIFEVAPIIPDEVPTGPERLAPLRPALRQVYVAFVIDTTASMQPTILAVRDLATRFAEDVARRSPDATLHLGAVEYRDDGPGLGFRARVATPFTGLAGFRNVVHSLEAALHEDGSVSECVLDGLALALPGTRGGLTWPSGREGELATKLVVLVGDAPDHAPDLRRAEDLAGRARAEGIAIVPVRVDRPGSLPGEARGRLDSQWRTLAASSYRPGPMSPVFSLPEAGSGELAKTLGGLVDDRLARARAMADLAAAEDEGRLADYVASQGKTMVEVAPLLDAMRRGGLAPRRTRRKVPTIRRGWIAERLGDTRLVTVDALIAPDEVGIVVAELEALRRSGASDALPLVNAVALGELALLDVDRARLSPDEQRRRRSALPPVSEPRGSWTPRLARAIAAWTRLRDAPDAVDPRRPLAGYPAVPFGLVDF